MKVFTTIRAIFLPLLLILETALSCSTALIATFLIRSRKVDTYLIQLWCRGICFLVGIKPRVKGLENIPPGGVIYVFNHQSLLDIPVIHAGILRDFRFGAKIELFKVPLFGATMRALGALPIARGNRSDAIRVLEAAATRMQNGESFVLAPEGTRQKEPRIGEFKSGPFILAIKAKRPLVPVVIKNIHAIMPRKALLIHRNRWTSFVDVTVLKAVDGAEFNFDQREDFKNRVREVMAKEYDSH